MKFDLFGVGMVSAPLPSTGTWHLITGTYDGSTMDLYVDGVVVASAAHTGALAVTSDPLDVGNKNGSVAPSDTFHGLLDDVRVYPRAISAAEVQSLMQEAVNLAPAAEYEFDSSSAIDSSGNGNNGTLVGGPTFTTGVTGQTIQLNGSNQYVTVANSSDLNPTSAITLSAWINATDWNGNRRIIQKGNTDDQYRLTAESGVLKFDVHGVGVITAALPSTGVWHLIIGTYDGTTMKLYVDGVVVASAAATGSIAVTSDPLDVGNKNGSVVGSDTFHGDLDDVRIYDRAISASEIQSLLSE
jgi:hypothetical protein